MPAPVSFTLSLAPLPVNFEGTLQEWAAAVVDRLTVTPAEPWSSFQNGGTIGGSDVGPILLNGLEWRVFSASLGGYTYHIQNGAGLVDRTVSLTKLASGAPGCVVVFDAAGLPNALQPGANGQVLSMVTNNPAWSAPASAPGVSYFEATVGTSHPVATNGDTTRIDFDTLKFSNLVAYDTANARIDIPAGQTWFFYCALQLEDDAPSSSSVQVIAAIGSADNVCMVRNYVTAQARDGFSWSGIMRFEAASTVGVSVQVSESGGGAADGMSVAGNQGNTRFGGYRIS